MPPAEQSSGRVALVLAGGGARGAYEIGALSALLPQLEPDERPQIVVGTSVGAINAAYIAAHADCSAEGVAEGGVRLWREIDYDSVLKPLLSLSEGRRLLSYLGEVLGSSCARTESVLDPKPLASTLGKVPIERIHANVVSERLTTAAVVATSGRTSTSVVFHDGGKSPPPDAHRGISYVSTKLTEDHVRASAAIPLLFPAVPIEEEGERRWYFDGGTRLNTPIKPALALGAERVIVIALNSLAPMHAGEADARPDALDGAAQLIQAVLVDPLVNDVHTLAMVNELLAGGSTGQVQGQGQGQEQEQEQEQGQGQEQEQGQGQGQEGGRPKKSVPYMLIAPRDPLEIGNIATEIYCRRFSSLLSFMCSPSLSSLGHLVNAGRSAVHGELLSYLLFAKELIERLIELGRGDAERWLSEEHDEGRWQVGRL